jgi:hypothetical protein
MKLITRGLFDGPGLTAPALRIAGVGIFFRCAEEHWGILRGWHRLRLPKADQFFKAS